MKRLFLFSVLCLGAVALFGTHNRSGYIRVEQVGEFAIEAVIITLTDSNSQPADRDTLTICWGDGSTERVARNPEATQILQNNVQRNMYVARHTYEQKGTFTVCMTDPNRNSGILNVNAPNSGQIAFHLQTSITLVSFAEGNTTPQIFREPLEPAYAHTPFVYQPNVTDQEGDSIAFELITPMAGLDTPVPNFVYPNEVEPEANGTFTLDESTGELRWDAPVLVGEYNIAILIKSFRAGQVIDATVLDMQILVLSSDPTSVADREAGLAGIKIYPNPAIQQQVMVELENWQRPVPYRISNQQGQVLMSGQLQDWHSLINLETLPPAAYYFSVQQAQSWRSKPFVKIE